MSRAYNEIMEHITVTGQMRQRILANVENADIGPQKRPTRARARRRYWAAAACVAVLLLGAVTLPRYFATERPGPGITQTTPQFTQVSSLEELEAIVGFRVQELTELPFEVTDVAYTAYGSETAEIRYSGATGSAVLRKADGNESPSGDYTQYAEELTITASGNRVTLKGEDGRYVLALWQDDSFSYSVRLGEGAGQATWERLLLSLR